MFLPAGLAYTRGMQTEAIIPRALEEVREHLRSELLPYWHSRGEDVDCGGYLTYFDAGGRPTGDTCKTLVCQARMLYMDAAVFRSGHGGEPFLDRAGRCWPFVRDHFWDADYGGWYWMTEPTGQVRHAGKIVYGHALMIYALSEFAMASGHPEALDYAVRTYETLEALAADNAWGGFAEFFEEDWSPRPTGTKGGGRKSLDVHMHLMEAFTNLYEVTGAEIYRRRTSELINLILARMIHPVHGTGIAQFGLDWQPLRQILFDDVWGADREAEDPAGRPLDNTSYGHNVELAWLMRHACKVCGFEESPFRPHWLRLYAHAAEYGLDWSQGGLFCEGPHAGPARERNKEFWQQAEALTGFLDAYQLTGEDRFLDAYGNIHRFVFDRVIDHEVGEWRPLFNQDNAPLAKDLGTAWKIGYHTVRAMIECERRLLRIREQHHGQAGTS